jgi:hypothetical protein
MQTQQGTEGAISTLSRTVKNEGVLAVYKGVTSPLIGMMFETAVLFVGKRSEGGREKGRGEESKSNE